MSTLRGVIQKKGGLANVEWQNRFIMLTEPKVISYYLSENHSHPQGTIQLEGATVVNTTKNNLAPWTFEIRAGSRKYAFRVSTEEELTQWISQIQGIIDGTTTVEPTPMSNANAAERMREIILDKFQGYTGEITFERYKETVQGEKREPERRVTLKITERFISGVELDETPLNDPHFNQMVKVRVSIAVANDDVIERLEKKFLELNPACTETKSFKKFPVIPGAVDNLTYDKSKCAKSDFRRKIGEIFQKINLVPIKITLNEEALSQALQEASESTYVSLTDELEKRDENNAAPDGEAALNDVVTHDNAASNVNGDVVSHSEQQEVKKEVAEPVYGEASVLMQDITPSSTLPVTENTTHPNNNFQLPPNMEQQNENQSGFPISIHHCEEVSQHNDETNKDDTYNNAGNVDATVVNEVAQLVNEPVYNPDPIDVHVIPEDTPQSHINTNNTVAV